MSSLLTLDVQPDLAFQSILHSVFQRPDSGEGIAIAFTSANSGDGVSYVSRKIASQLSAGRSESAICVSSAELCGGTWPGAPNRIDRFARSTEIVSKNAWEDWHAKVNEMRARYRYSIIDCPSLSTGSDVLSLAPHLDGIVVVVAANETHKAQITNVERQLRLVNGKILGFVLNKRQYTVPEWLYKRL